MTSEVAAKTAFYGVMACWWLFVMTFWLRKPRPAQEARRAPSSYAGLFLQAVGYSLVWLFPLEHGGWRLAVDRTRPGMAWAIAAAALVIGVGSVLLVIWAARRLGKQWSLGARLVVDHELIEDGPYAFVRNPIYTGMFGLLVATGLVGSTLVLMVVAVVVFLMGTYIRIQVEEKLLREGFGEKFEEYARRVPALIPGIY